MRFAHVFTSPRISFLSLPPPNKLFVHYTKGTALSLRTLHINRLPGFAETLSVSQTFRHRTSSLLVTISDLPWRTIPPSSFLITRVRNYSLFCPFLGTSVTYRNQSTLFRVLSSSGLLTCCGLFAEYCFSMDKRLLSGYLGFARRYFLDLG